MQKFLDYSQKASRSYTVADHMVFTTYNVVKDPKLLLLAATHLQESFDNAISALLYYDYYYKRISTFPSDFSQKLDLFRRYSCQKYNVPREIIQIIQDVRNIVRDHKKSEMEFRRKNKFIIASKNYRLRTLTIEKLKNFVLQSKPLISKVLEVKKLNDRRTS
jgi:hypothetical protein